MTMDADQRAMAAVEGLVVERVTIPRFEPSSYSQDAPDATYTVRVSIKPGDSHVEVTPRPPSVRERGQALLEARRILQDKEERTATVNDRQMLTHAVINLTREINALP